MDLEYTHYNIDLYPKELYKLPKEELKKKIKALKVPWWNNFYVKYLHNHKKRLLLIFLLMVRRDYSWSGLKLIWKILKIKKNDL